MLYVCTTLPFTFTFSALAWWTGKQLRGQFKPLSYECLWGLPELPRGTYIFSDLERLSTEERRRAAAYAERLIAAGCPVLNHPAQYEDRFDLLKRLHREGRNSWNVYGMDEPMETWTFPVFIRARNDHQGGLTPLLYTPEEVRTQQRVLQEAWAMPELMVCEYKDFRDPQSGRHTKYSVQRIGRHLIYGHLLEGSQWEVKTVKDIDQSLVDRDETFIREQPHRQEIEQLFHDARIDYGRIDYGLREGRIEVFEFNTAPAIGLYTSPLKLTYPSRQKKAHALVAALLELSQQAVPGTGPIASPCSTPYSAGNLRRLARRRDLRLLRYYLGCQRERLRYFITRKV